MLDDRAALDEEAIVLGVVDRARRVVAGERAHGIHVVPERERHDLGQSAELPAENPRTAVAGVER